MSIIDQCPSTKGEREVPSVNAPLLNAGGRPAWRSLEEYAGSASFRDWAEREFPAGASELDLREAADAGAGGGESRRGFMKLMAASFALAGAATIPGCRRPDHKILAYSGQEPEHTIPGKPTFYATSMALPGGGAEGLLVETHTHRPTKIEGNPLHPASRGKTSVFAQAEILRLYDPERLRDISQKQADGTRAERTAEQFTAWAKGHFDGLAADGGASLAVIADRVDSPTLWAVQAEFAQRFPRATWVWWDAVDARRNELDGTAAAFGRAMRVHHRLSGARCVLSLDADFACEGPDHVRLAGEFAATRRVWKSGEAMSRLFVAESRPTGTGSLADHRMALGPAKIAGLLGQVAAIVLRARGGDAALVEAASSMGAGLPAEQAALIAEDLLEAASTAPGSAVVIAGPTVPAAGHALVAAVNAALGAAGRSVRYTPAPASETENAGAALAALAKRMSAGSVGTVVCVDCNPVYDAPAGSGFAEAFKQVAASVTLSVGRSETASASAWSVNAAHFLEAWGDTAAYDGTVAPVQPMIAPLFAPAMSAIEFVAMLAGRANPDGYALVREAWQARMGGGSFDRAFRRALHDGVVAGSDAAAGAASVDAGRVAAAVAGAGGAAGAGGDGAVEVVFSAGRVGDGRYANCGWLQELPQMGTQVAWDNPAVMSPATAERLGLMPKGGLHGMYTRAQFPEGRMASLKVPGAGEMSLPAWILPGMPDDVVHVQVGYGRADAGAVGDGVGFNTYAVRPASASAVGGATLTRADGWYTIASTQNHWSLESRTSLVRAIDRKWFEKHAGVVATIPDEVYGTAVGTSSLSLGEQLGELSHTPPNVSAYKNPQNASTGDAAAGSAFAMGPQWGMTIDLASCTGCGVCTVACQAENNIPIVGKQEVMKGREMTWIRVDRYFTGDDLNSPEEMLHQPVACVHCENAPCETVCPVNATVHGPEGTNNMAYNQCIGTRYCANNCPYKVRRFNFFDWGQTKYNGSFLGESLIGGDDGRVSQRDFNKNFIPPRLREKLNEIEKMKMNPDVTVRGRGVMEKCTYCIQRVNEARQEVKVRDIWKRDQTTAAGAGYTAPIPDGFFQTACQQACPTGSIVFGDVLDPASEVTRTRNNTRSYALLNYLNTRPRTSHLVRVRNPNEKLLRLSMPAAYAARLEHDPIHAHHGGGHGDGHGDGHGGDGHGGGHNGEPSGGHGGEQHGSAFFDRLKKFEDRGYAASLRVLS